MKKKGPAIKFSGPWAELAEKAGGVGALAGLIGVDVRQIRRWGNGESAPSQFLILKQIAKVCKKLGGPWPL